MGQERIWDYYQNEGAHSFRGALPRLRALVAMLPPGSAVLNVGIGDGALERHASAKGLTVWSLDPSTRAVAKLNDVMRDLGRARVGTLQDPPFDAQSFDCVVASEVLEHLDEDSLIEALQATCRLLRPGGLFIGTVPAEEDLAIGEVVCPSCGELFHRWGHLQSFDKVRLAELLTSRFENVAIRRRYFVSLRLLNWKGLIVCGLRVMLSRLGVKGSSDTLVFTAQRTA